MNRFLFVYGELRHGGIETLIVRFAHFMAKLGRPLALCIPGGELAGQIGKDTELLLWANRKQAVQLATAWIGRSPAPVTMISFDPISAALGLAIERRIGNPKAVVHISGVYHPRAYFMTGERHDRILLNRLVAKAVGDHLIFYMNAECRAEHERRWRTSVIFSPVIPLPIEERPPAWKSVAGEQLRIVSVGRLVDFKTYNLSAAGIARECNEAGLPVSWDIYGAGPLADAIHNSIDSHGVGKAVTLKGTLPYAGFPKVIAGYDLFIGMGTAALEAAMLGVPTIVATESEPRRTYGFVDQLPFGNVGERQVAPPPHDLAEVIRTYASLDMAGRKEISRKCRQAVLGYSLDHCVERLDRLAQDAAPAPPMAFKKAVSALYEGMTDSRLAELARRVQALARN